MPRSKGFSASVLGARGHCEAVYDVTILYDGKAPSFFELLSGNVKEVTLHVERFSFDQLQGDENDLHDWIVERFYLKNKMISERRGNSFGH